MHGETQFNLTGFSLCVMASAAAGQGLTLVHFSAQPERFLTLETSLKRLNTPSIPA